MPHRVLIDGASGDVLPWEPKSRSPLRELAGPIVARAALLVVVAGVAVASAGWLDRALGPVPPGSGAGTAWLRAVEALLGVGGVIAFLAGGALWLDEDGLFAPGGWPEEPDPGPRWWGGGGGGEGPPPPWLKWLLLALGLALTLAALHRIARRLDLLDLLMRNSFLACALFTVAAILLVLGRPRVLASQNWKKLAEVWLKLGGAASLAVGGIGVLVSTDVLKSVTKMTGHSPYVDQRFLVLAYFLLFAVFGLAWLFTTLGRAAAPSDESRIPPGLFAAAFTCAVLGCAGFFTLFFDTLLLAVHAVATSAAPPAA